MEQKYDALVVELKDLSASNATLAEQSRAEKKKTRELAEKIGAFEARCEKLREKKRTCKQNMQSVYVVFNNV